MADQVIKFNMMGIVTGVVSSGMTEEAVVKIKKGDYQLLLISPEALLSSKKYVKRRAVRQ